MINSIEANCGTFEEMLFSEISVFTFWHIPSATTGGVWQRFSWPLPFLAWPGWGPAHGAHRQAVDEADRTTWESNPDLPCARPALNQPSSHSFFFCPIFEKIKKYRRFLVEDLAKLETVTTIIEFKIWQIWSTTSSMLEVTWNIKKNFPFKIIMNNYRLNKNTKQWKQNKSH